MMRGVNKRRLLHHLRCFSVAAVCGFASICAGLLDTRPDTYIPKTAVLYHRVNMYMPRDVPENERRAFQAFIAAHVGPPYEHAYVVRSLFARKVGDVWQKYMHRYQDAPLILDSERAFHVIIDALRDN